METTSGTNINIEVRNEFTRLLNGTKPVDVVDSFDMLLNSGLMVINSKPGNFENIIDHELDLLFQMTISKCFSLKQQIEGFEYENPFDGAHFNHSIDPFAMWPIIRSQFEAYCTFNNILLQHFGDQREVIYNLWVLSGLKYRQDYEVADPESVQKKAVEANNISHLIRLIKGSEHYRKSKHKERGKIKNYIKDRDWELYFVGDNCNKLGFGKMFERAGVNLKAFNSQYSFMSLNTHPSNVSVFQFARLYEDGEHYRSGLFAIGMSRIIIAFIIRDYCYIYQHGRQVYEKLPPLAQLLINSINAGFRGEEFRMNNIHEQY